MGIFDNGKFEQLGGMGKVRGYRKNKDGKGGCIGVEYNGEVTIEKGQWRGSKTHDIDVFVQRGNSAVNAVEEMEEDDSSLDLI